MVRSQDPSLSPGSPPKPTVVSAAPSSSDRSAPCNTALRRRRQEMARQLHLIANLRTQIDELRAEVSSLESIIGAQAEAIEALRRQKPGSEG